ncbi:MAG: biotin synthase BioB [Nitrospinota bacterium]
MKNKIVQLEEKACRGESITKEDALLLLGADPACFWDLIASADRIRRRFKGEKISLCAIINARSGMCAENCAFCAQSVHSSSQVPEYSLLGSKEVLASAKRAVEKGASKFGIVTSGRGINDKHEHTQVKELILALKKDVSVHRCASLGILYEDELKELQAAGLKEYHHNLETSRSFFSKICTTHKYEDNEQTVVAAKKAGLRVCSGGIFGMGETLEQRVELAFELRDLKVDSVPVNFLNPVSGTRLEGAPLLEPKEALKIISMLRFVMPDKDIKVAGGREVVLRDLQAVMFAAGANSTMLGNYLTTKGRNAQQDIQLIQDLGLSPVREE